MAKNTLHNTTARNTFLWGWVLILPTVVGLMVLNIYPMIMTFYQSLCKTGDFGRGNVFIGLKNYTKLFPILR